MPAIPIAESSAPIVVGISATSSEISVVSEIGVSANRPNGRKRRDDDHEDQRQAGEQDVQRDLVRGLAPRGALDQRDHPVQERVTGLLGDLDDDPVREHARAAGDRRAIAAGLADHGSGLARDRRLVDRRDPLDHGPVAGDQLAGLDDDDVALAQLGGLDWSCRSGAWRRSPGASCAACRPARGRGPRRTPRPCSRTRPSATARTRSRTCTRPARAAAERPCRRTPGSARSRS